MAEALWKPNLQKETLSWEAVGGKCRIPPEHGSRRPRQQYIQCPYMVTSLFLPLQLQLTAKTAPPPQHTSTNAENSTHPDLIRPLRLGQVSHPLDALVVALLKHL